jgi:transaldolase
MEAAKHKFANMPKLILASQSEISKGEIMAENVNTQRTSDSGVSIWLDDLSRTRIESGNLQQLIAENNVVGVTTNPSIFQKALHQVGPYDVQLKELGRINVEAAVQELTTTDVRNATDIFHDVAEQSGYVNGRVSIEVDPRLAHNTEETEKQAVQLWEKVNRPNAMIKIPATLEGLPAITATLAKGISVNVTLIFSLERYEQVIDAYIEGMVQADQNGHDLTRMGSVASFFVSRVDAAVDKLLEENGSDEAKALEGKAAVANARLAYELFEKKFASDPRWAALEAKGAHKQRPLWASTGTKNAAYSDCKYVDELVAPNVVNTMPEATLVALADHGNGAPSIEGTYEESHKIMEKLSDLGISIKEVTDKLEADGVAAFIDSWSSVLEDVQAGIDRVNG